MSDAKGAVRRRAGGLRRAWRLYAGATGLLVALQVGLALVGYPAWLVDWLEARDATLSAAPRLIVCLGGSGIPGETGLTRVYYAAEFARQFTGATVIVSLPCDGEPATNSVGRMRDELVLRGVASARVRMEHAAWGTDGQARAVAGMVGEEDRRQPVLLVTSPYHCRRALLCFRKAGFERIGCAPAGDTEAESDPGQAARVRYGFWSALHWQLLAARELAAMAYYRLRGRI